jgi:(p)ppGpp synthase/HD superfamily hydrolase
MMASMNDQTIDHSKVAIANAMALVARHHAGQLHSAGTQGEMEFAVHAMDVAIRTRELLRVVEVDLPEWVLIAAALLHDVIEDSPYDRVVAAMEVRAGCGPDVYGIVALLTDVEAPNRRLSKAATLPLIATSVGATLVKCADRDVNQDATIRWNSLKFAMMYHREYADFRATLYPTLPSATLWDHLDRQDVAMNRMIEASRGRN